jgi:hypothetical protein
MALDFSYEELTSEEADFILSIYDAVSKLHREGRPVTLVGISNILHVSTSELADYLYIIVKMLDKIEEEQQI